MDKKYQYTPPYGFTLLELLISLTIVGIILLIIFGSLRIGARAWEKGEADTEAQQRERIVLQLVKRQVASICGREIKRKEDQSYLFKGDNTSMEFMTTIPANYGIRSGLAYVKYAIRTDKEGEEQLALYEQDGLSLETRGLPDEPNDESFHVLIPHAYKINFEYLKKNENGDQTIEWQETWEPDSDKGLPYAARMTFQRERGKPPIQIIARIYTEVTQPTSNGNVRK